MPKPLVKRPSAYLEVSLENVSLTLGDTAVLQDIRWRVRPGERWILAGGNGAGKTQLLKILSGDVWPTPTGAEKRLYRWRGQAYAQPEAVKDEIAYLGPERQDRYERYDWNHSVTRIVGTGVYRSDIPLEPLTPADRGRIAALLRRLHIEQLATRRMLTLSYGERRLVLLARALASRPGLLLLDEVTNGLDTRHHERLRRYLAASSRSAMPWVLTTHRAEDIPRSANRLLVVEAGRILYRGALTAAALKRAYRHGLAAAEPAAPAGIEPSPRTRAAKPGRPLITLRNANVFIDEVPILKAIDLRIGKGECWVVHGGNGAGKSTLMRTLYGDHGVAVGGAIERDGIEPGVPLSQFRARVGLIAPHLQTEHPQYLTVIDAVVSGLHSSIGLNDAPTRAETRRARAALQDFGLAALAQRTLRALSYGQLRRVLFARAWVARPELLLLDEPFTGVDTPTRKALLAHVDRLLASGLTLVMATHHRKEWPSATTHELELHGGRVRYRGALRG